MKIGYCRVSTADQHLHLQKDALEKAGCAKIFEHTSTGKHLDRPGLAAALSHLRAGDTLVVYKLDRLGRTIKGLMTFTENLHKDGIDFESLCEKIDTSTAMGKCFFHITSAFAELERNLIVERTNAGLAAARARGRVGGRPRKVTTSNLRLAMSMMANPANQGKEVAKLIGINRTVLYRYVNGDGSLKPLGLELLHGTAERREAEWNAAAD
jgi:DNA invertase Pin-like site-specific DNA recombinase